MSQPSHRRAFALLWLLLLLIFCRVITLLPVKRWTSMLGFTLVDSSAHCKVAATDFPSDLWFVPGYLEKLSSWAPWSNRCLPAAVAAGIALRHYRVSSRLVLGARLEVSSLAQNRKVELVAHAWLVVGGQVVCGRAGMSQDCALASWNLVAVKR